MSADNYYVIRRAPEGGFAAVMGFASDDREWGEIPVESRDKRFPTIAEALNWCDDAYTEYGTSIHPECGTWTTVDAESVLTKDEVLYLGVQLDFLKAVYGADPGFRHDRHDGIVAKLKKQAAQ